MASCTAPVGDHESYEVINSKDAEECIEAFRRKGITGCLDYLKLKRDQWKKIPLNVAVIGKSGSGKSTFINTMRGLSEDDEGAAEVGTNETTIVITPYPHPTNKNLVFWDLPGVESLNFPKETYLKKIKFDQYDCYIIVTETRFYEVDAWLGDEVRKTGKGLYYTRSKIGQDVWNSQKTRKGPDVDALIKDIRTRMTDEIRKRLQFEPKLFLVDCHNGGKYDFDKLQSSIVEELPDQKRNAMALSLPAFSKSMIKTKVLELRKRAGHMGLLSAAVAGLPIPGVTVAVDAGILLGETTFYFSQLGLDEASLRARADLCSTDIKLLQKKLLQYLPTEIDWSFIKPIVDGYIGGSGFAGFRRFIPIFGTLTGDSVISAYRTLEFILDKIEAAALEIADFTGKLL